MSSLHIIKDGVMFLVRTTLFFLNLFYIFFIPFLPILILKIIFNFWKPARDFLGALLVKSVEHWTVINCWIFKNTLSTQWDIEIDGELKLKDSYLVMPNHQAWTDIFVLQYALTGKAPLPRFFIKSSLLYLPIFGIAWWGLDMPFMKRYSKEYLAKHPEKKGQDMQTTIRSCQKFKGINTCLINFLEGTRFTPEKHIKQESPYKNLLKPKSGGVAFALEALDGAITHYVDAVLFYPNGKFSVFDFFMNRLDTVVVRITANPIPTQFMHMDYANNSEQRELFQQWITRNWQAKDDIIESLKQKYS